MAPLPTKKQKQLLDYLAAYIKRHGYSPTHEEMCLAMGVSSVATIHDHLLQLAKKKLIRIYKGAVRGIEVLRATNYQLPIAQLELPLFGYIAAGQPLEAISDPSETVKVPADLIAPGRRNYVLQVRGESMIEEGIFDGDYVVIEEQDRADDGDIVVALLENGLATLKRYFREKHQVRLEPANSRMSPIFTTDVKIQGKVKGLIRRY
jgi:repressor LexA